MTGSIQTTLSLSLSRCCDCGGGSDDDRGGGVEHRSLSLSLGFMVGLGGGV